MELAKTRAVLLLIFADSIFNTSRVEATFPRASDRMPRSERRWQSQRLRLSSRRAAISARPEPVIPIQPSAERLRSFRAEHATAFSVRSENCVHPLMSSQVRLLRPDVKDKAPSERREQCDRSRLLRVVRLGKTSDREKSARCTHLLRLSRVR